MGTWAVATWWGTGSRPTEPDLLFDGSDDRWAMRTAWAASGLWQVDTCTKYGSFGPVTNGQPHVGVVPHYGTLHHDRHHPGMPFPLGFNYLWAAPRPSRSRVRRVHPLLRRALVDAAGLLGDTVATVEAPNQAMLCLPQIIEPASADVCWSLDTLDAVPDPTRPVIEALALSAQDESVNHFLLGLWTPQYGYLHTGHLIVRAQPDDGEVQIQLTGLRQPVTEAIITGPTGHMIFADLTPTPCPTFPWPLADRH